MSFGTYEWERAYARKPRGPEPRALHFRISRVVPPEDLQVPPLREIDVGGSDDLQVSGFYDKEGGGRPHLPLDGTLRLRLSARARGRRTRSPSPPSTGAPARGRARARHRLHRRRDGRADSRRGANGRSTRCGCPTRCPRVRPCCGWTCRPSGP